MNQGAYFEKTFSVPLISAIVLFISISMCVSCGGGGGGGASGNKSKDNVLPPTSVMLTWEAPTARVDGTPLTDLAGYYVYYGTISRNYIARIDVGQVLTFRIDDLRPGVYFFAVTAYDGSGNQSLFSNEVSKTIYE